MTFSNTLRIISLAGWLAAAATAQTSDSTSVTETDACGQLVAATLSDPMEDGESSEVLDRIQANTCLTGTLTEAIKLNAIQELLKQQQLYPELQPGSVPPRGVPVWQQLGPTMAKYEVNGVTLKVTDSGRVRTILPHPTDPDTVYVLTSGGGLWKTTTFTHTNPRWQAKTDAVLSTAGGSVAFGRTPDVLYLGIGDPFDVKGSIAGVMVKSTDGGNTWSPFVNLPGATSVRDVKVDTSGPADVVLVATDYGLFRSADNGATYTRMAAATGQTFAHRSIWSLTRTSSGWLASSQSSFLPLVGSFNLGSIAYSADQGATWLPTPNTGSGYSNAGRTTLAVGAAGDATVFAFASAPSGLAQRDLFKSTDGGLNWVALHITSQVPANAVPLAQTTMDLLNGQAYYNQMILVDPLDTSRNTIYLGGQLATAKTTDGGNTWALTSFWLPGAYAGSANLPYVHADCQAAAFSTLGGQNTIFFGTDGGVSISQDAGKTFSDDKNNGIVALLANSIVSSTKNSQSLLTGAQDEGTRARLGDSSVFDQVVGGDGEGVGWSQANNAFALTTLPGSAIRRTQNLRPNTFSTWVRPSLPVRRFSDFYPFYSNMATPVPAVDPTGTQFFTYTGWRVFKTADGGDTWNVIGEAGVSPGLRPKGSAPIFRFTHHAMGISPLDTNHIAVSETGFGFNGGILAITTDGGLSWNERHLLALVPGYGGFNTSPAWANNATLYISSENVNYGAIHLLKSTDGGTSWAVAQTGLPDVPINRILVDPRDAAGNTVYAATWIGVYFTTNGGASWKLFGAGLPNVAVSDLYFAPDGSFLRAATYGRGIWEIKP